MVRHKNRGFLYYDPMHNIGFDTVQTANLILKKLFRYSESHPMTDILDYTFLNYSNEITKTTYLYFALLYIPQGVLKQIGGDFK